ncbi:MAG: archease [Candidatus Micrarchaeota archaeon]|nr:archease [Candidatus Micrarchaeota archaeon]
MERPSYRYVDHTADIEFIASGRTIESAVNSAILAMADTTADVKAVARSAGKSYTFTVSEKAVTIEDMVWEVLQQILSVADFKDLFVYKASRLKFSDGKKGPYRFSAKLYGKKRNPRFSRMDIKGVSKFDLSVRKPAGRFRISVVVDV